MAMVQYGLWPNCTNNCDFCLLADRIYKSEEERLYMLEAIKENIQIVDWKNKFSDGISLLGGEIYYTDSSKIKTSFLDLLEKIIKIILEPNATAKYSTVTNGIYNSEVLLEPSLDLFKKHKILTQVDLNFSWDLKYRFHSKESLDMMIKNTNLVYDKYGITPNVQTCLTQYLIDLHLNDEFNIFDYQNSHFPHSTLTFLYPHKINTGKTVSDFFFTRDSLFRFIKWLKRNNYFEALRNFINSVINSAQFKYTGLWIRDDIYKGNHIKKEIEQTPTLEKKQLLLECGHSQLYKCYSDSDNCMLCDLLKVI